jgi:REP element-mobilizing transposase RayT
MMKQEREAECPNRRSARLPTYNYTSTGAYFVTICTDQRRPLFLQPELHRCLVETWQGLPQRFPSITLDEFVIMPDHIHCILWLQRSSKDGPSLAALSGLTNP